MKLQTSANKGEVKGVLSETAFGIGNGTLLLEYLRSNIYKNPVQALTREIASNARDAHREVDSDPNNPTTKETAIQITFPNDWNGDFQVQDWGPGISPDRMSDIFTQFGNSTKRDSNDETGGFGLGCKTPFAYGDSFTVVTVHAGVKYHYSAILDGGAGKMVLLSQEDTDEPSGTIISVPAHKDDWESFTEYTLLATALWDVKPVLKGISPAPKYPNIETYFGGDDWSLANSLTLESIPGLDSGTYAVVDGIPYKVERYQMSNIEYSMREALDCSFHLKFEVGELDLAPSRDHLRYTKETQARILKRVEIALASLKEQVQEKVDKAPSYYDALVAYRNLKAETSAEVMNLAGGKRWNGTPLKFDISMSDVGKWAKMTKFWMKYGEFKTRRTAEKINKLDDKILVILNEDEKSLPRRGIEALIEDSSNPYTVVEVITCPKAPTSREYRQYMGWYPDHKVEYKLEVLDRYRIGKLSAYPMPKGRKGGGTGRRKAADGNIMGYTFWENRNSNICTNSKEVPNDGGVYIEVDYKEKTYKTNGREITQYRTLRSLEGFIDEKVIGFSKTRVKKLDSSWRTLEEAVIEKIEEQLEDVTFEELREAKFSGEYSFSDKFYRLNRITEKLDVFEHQDGAMVTYITSCNEIAETKKIANSIWNVLSWLDYDTSSPGKIPLAALHRKVVATYKLLPYLECYNMKTETYKEIVRYINLIDAELASATPVALAS
jgi:hypothetical protein